MVRWLQQVTEGKKGAKILVWGGVKSICVYVSVMSAWILTGSPAARTQESRVSVRVLGSVLTSCVTLKDSMSLSLPSLTCKINLCIFSLPPPRLCEAEKEMILKVAVLYNGLLRKKITLLYIICTVPLGTSKVIT